MGRCLSLFGLVVFTLGIGALASMTGPATPDAGSRRDENVPAGPPRPARTPALAYPAAFSLN